MNFLHTCTCTYIKDGESAAVENVAISKTEHQCEIKDVTVTKNQRSISNDRVWISCADNEDTTVKIKIKNIRMKYDAVSEIMSWQAFLRSYSESLPLTVLAVGPTLPKNTILTLHCTRRMQVVTVETLDGCSSDIPLNNNLKFAILYNPTNDVQEAIQGFVFTSIASIISASPQPKLVCSKMDWSDGMFSVIKNELLILGRETKDNVNQITNGIVVYSLNTRSSKWIPLTCVCVYSVLALLMYAFLCKKL